MSERVERLKELFERALRLEAASHAEFLRSECGEDEELRAELSELLDLKLSGSFLGGSIPAIFSGRDNSGETEHAGSRIGTYRLLEKIASGGMGTVWRAARDDEQFEKLVAIKLIKRGMDSAAIVQRFHRERRLLAQLEHPGIAQLLDGGTSERGQPYMVMELVRGEPLDIAARSLPLDQRLELFAKVCDAVDAAHELGIVHRDLKPSNVLITAEGQPKLLDFGIAKVLSTEEHELTLLTRTAERLLTPRYAAPEQVLGQEITTATDVYALGVLLYELLSACSPYAHCASARELETAICDSQPSRPSTRTRGTTRRRLRGDLDTIVLRALAKAPERRYPRAGALAADLRRHLRREPIAARRDSLLYRVATFASRNRWTLAVFLAIVTALSIGLALARSESRFAERMRMLAEQRAADVEIEAAYSRLSAASEALDAQREATARNFLEAIPPSHRDWEWQHLSRRLDRSTLHSTDLRLAGIEKGQRVVWMPDGEHIAVAGWDAQIHLVSRQTLEIVRSCSGDSQVEVLAVSPDGTLFAFCDDSRNVTLVDVDSGNVRTRIGQEGDIYRCLDFAPDGMHLVAGTSGGELRIFDGPQWTLTASARLGRRAELRAVRYSPSGERIAASCSKSRLHIYELSTGTFAQSFKHHDSRAFCVDWSPDGQRIATGSMDRSLCIVDATSGELLRERVRLQGEIWNCAFLPSGREVIAGGPYLLRADVFDNREYATFCGRGSMALSRDGTQICVSSTRGLKLFDAETQGTMNAQISEGWTRGLAVSPDGRYIASVDRSEGGIFEVSGSTLCRIPELELRGEFVCFDRDGAQLVVLRRDDVAEIRSAPAWKVAREIPDAEAHFAVVRGEHLIFAAAYPQKGLKLLHLATDEAPRTFGSESIRAFDISPDGTQLAGIAMLPKAFPKIPCALEMWSYPEGRLLWSRELDQEGLAIAYAPDGSLVLGSKGGLSIWKPGEQEPSVRVTHEAAIQSIAFHPGGRRMATNDSDGSVRLWDVPSYRPIVELARHEGAGFRMAWSSDGSMLVSGGKDGMLFALDGR